MSILISNSADAAHYLKQNQAELQKSLKRLSSGKKIIGGGDDPGGLAVAMKINASIKRLAGAENNVQNGISFLEVQDGLLETMGNILTRMSELKGLHTDDPLKDTSEKAAYESEYNDLITQLGSIKDMTFNGQSLFGTSDDTKEITIDADGNSTIEISISNLNQTNLNAVAGLGGGTAETISVVTVTKLSDALNELAELRGGNGSGQNRLQFTAQNLSLQKNNMMSALSRIEDIDLAEETANLAKYSIMTQASAAMVAQANSQNDIALMLLS
jgi:flagellin